MCSLENTTFLLKYLYRLASFSDDQLMSNLICHSVSFILLAMLNCSNSVLVRGVYIDAEEPAGQCVIFPVYYIRLFVQKERAKKQRRMLDSLEKGGAHTELLEKSDQIPAQIIKAQSKSIEMISVVCNKVRADMGDTEKEKHTNGEHKIGQ